MRKINFSKYSLFISVATLIACYFSMGIGVSVATAQTSGLVAAYGFNEGSGTTTADASGGGNTGTLVNGLVWTAQGKFGNALSFDGVDDFVSVGNNVTLGLGSAGTIEAWVKLNALGRWHGVIAKGSANNDSVHNYALEVNNFNRVRCILGNGASALLVDSSITLTTGQFRHLACS